MIVGFDVDHAAVFFHGVDHALQALAVLFRGALGGEEGIFHGLQLAFVFVFDLKHEHVFFRGDEERDVFFFFVFCRGLDGVVQQIGQNDGQRRIIKFPLVVALHAIVQADVGALCLFQFVVEDGVYGIVAGIDDLGGGGDFRFERIKIGDQPGIFFIFDIAFHGDEMMLPIVAHGGGGFVGGAHMRSEIRVVAILLPQNLGVHALVKVVDDAPVEEKHRHIDEEKEQTANAEHRISLGSDGDQIDHNEKGAYRRDQNGEPVDHGDIDAAFDVPPAADDLHGHEGEDGNKYLSV